MNEKALETLMRRYCLLAVLLFCATTGLAYADDLSAIVQSCGRPSRTAANYNSSTESWRRSIAYKSSEGDMVFVNFKCATKLGPWIYLSASGDVDGLSCLAASGVHVQGSSASAAHPRGTSSTAGNARKGISARDVLIFNFVGIADLLVFLLSIVWLIFIWKGVAARARYEFEHRTSGGVVDFASFGEATKHNLKNTFGGCQFFISTIMMLVSLVAGIFWIFIELGQLATPLRAR
jgi:hypothetical protein